ncbi:hypothetical protein LI99_17620 [Mycolicibacterium smegmatis]|uniref:Uncharacterized protein n=1 Tax=Mycolicibacterium smegmatis (strain ATCC 700084 / mc(2)155) TaxID=246196 RepID=A0QY54_MYCS2|nr:hypothetical protein MSMEG_3539 [Mycolicibacterium smegmatis MC2 155]AIU15302.1 hypothetical protein LI99_17620 [Mycolicibacterium smegmatis]AIU08677.1 hypothetical protein LJ00_17615 [Mycolicibacterium smegmatis MC2 155]AIU21925.1 hypothetical protein LI98_17625 [Mycolicibacterium smegmatis]TBH47720.1 hypothetical protein EYS45_08940 [Mycolicibacterium smegmatis MC2 155]
MFLGTSAFGWSKVMYVMAFPKTGTFPVDRAMTGPYLMDL